MNPDDISRHVNACALMGCLRPPVGGSSPDHNRLRPRYCANQPPNPRPKNQPSRRRPPRGRSSVIRRPRRRGAMGSFAWPILAGYPAIHNPARRRYWAERPQRPTRPAAALRVSGTVDRDPQAAVARGGYSPRAHLEGFRVPFRPRRIHCSGATAPCFDQC